MELTPHPPVCERCRTMKSKLRHRKRQKDGTIRERWLCYECADAVLDGAEDEGKPNE